MAVEYIQLMSLVEGHQSQSLVRSKTGGWQAMPRSVVCFLTVLLAAFGPACANDNDAVRDDTPTKRVVLIQGICSSTPALNDDESWINVVKPILSGKYGLVDLPTGDPDDQVIEFGYSVNGWDEPYQPADTLRQLRTASVSFGDLLSAYPDSEFFVIGHSLGGLVALGGTALYGQSGAVSAVVTVSSPIAGYRSADLELSGRAIELFACRQLSTGGELSPVWSDLASGNPFLDEIGQADWSGTRVVTVANYLDRVVAADLAVLEPVFKAMCFDEGQDGFFELNHDTLLVTPEFADELLSVLFGMEESTRPCGSSS